MTRGGPQAGFFFCSVFWKKRHGNLLPSQPAPLEEDDWGASTGRLWGGTPPPFRPALDRDPRWGLSSQAGRGRPGLGEDVRAGRTGRQSVARPSLSGGNWRWEGRTSNELLRSLMARGLGMSAAALPHERARHRCQGSSHHRPPRPRWPQQCQWAGVPVSPGGWLGSPREPGSRQAHQACLPPCTWLLSSACIVQRHLCTSNQHRAPPPPPTFPWNSGQGGRAPTQRTRPAQRHRLNNRRGCTGASSSGCEGHCLWEGPVLSGPLILEDSRVTQTWGREEAGLLLGVPPGQGQLSKAPLNSASWVPHVPTPVPPQTSPLGSSHGHFL